MRFDRDPAAPGPLVTGFTEHGFLCGEEEYRGGLKLTPESIEAWSPGDPDALTLEDFGDLVDLAPSPEFVILGTGRALVRPAPALVAAIEELGIGIEAMDSRAAARAWGILRGEGRWIAAALLPLDA